MKLQYCSITGADDAVEAKDLVAMGEKYPFVEWAILYLPEWEGRNRFPTEKWIRNFSANSQGQHKAMHLCDSAFLGFVAGDKNVLDVMSGFKRIQLNLKFGNVEGKYDPADVVARVKSLPQHQFILQYTHEKKGLLPLFSDVPNHAVLFDASAGRGLLPNGWEAPLPGHFCGYAGGLNPDNVGENLQKIAAAAGDYTTWIDMETGVRTEDKFDFSKVERVLQTAVPHVLQSGAAPKAAQSLKN